MSNIELQAKLWRFTQHPRFFRCGPYTTDGDFHGHSVGLINPDNRSRDFYLGRGKTLKEALTEAVENPKAGQWESELALENLHSDAVNQQLLKLLIELHQATRQHIRYLGVDRDRAGKAYARVVAATDAVTLHLERQLDEETEDALTSIHT